MKELRLKALLIQYQFRKQSRIRYGGITSKKSVKKEKGKRLFSL
jgi:cytochrome c-type biogenesis protein CcmE